MKKLLFILSNILVLALFVACDRTDFQKGGDASLYIDNQSSQYLKAEYVFADSVDFSEFFFDVGQRERIAHFFEEGVNPSPEDLLQRIRFYVYDINGEKIKAYAQNPIDNGLWEMKVVLEYDEEFRYAEYTLIIRDEDLDF